jgi:hypothetical protein
MAETSPGFNVDYEIIPGTHAIRGIVRSIKRGVCFLPPSKGYPSEYPKHPERRNGAAGMLDAELAKRPGEIGGVAVQGFGAASMLDAAQDAPVLLPIIDDRQPRLEFPVD